MSGNIATFKTVVNFLESSLKNTCVGGKQQNVSLFNWLRFRMIIGGSEARFPSGTEIVKEETLPHGKGTHNKRPHRRTPQESPPQVGSSQDESPQEGSLRNSTLKERAPTRSDPQSKELYRKIHHRNGIHDGTYQIRTAGMNVKEAPDYLLFKKRLLRLHESTLNRKGNPQKGIPPKRVSHREDPPANPPWAFMQLFARVIDLIEPLECDRPLDVL